MRGPLGLRWPLRPARQRGGPTGPTPVAWGRRAALVQRPGRHVRLLHPGNVATADRPPELRRQAACRRASPGSSSQLRDRLAVATARASRWPSRSAGRSSWASTSVQPALAPPGAGGCSRPRADPRPWFAHRSPARPRRCSGATGSAASTSTGSSTRPTAPGGPSGRSRAATTASRVPALHVGGWYDVFADGTLTNWAGLRLAGRAPQRLVVGPWHHLPALVPAGPIPFGQASLRDLDADQLDWSRSVAARPRPRPDRPAAAGERST
mgnify:CR=1 FL=1